MNQMVASALGYKKWKADQQTKQSKEATPETTG
jgi:hypothetical protein